MKKTKKLLGLFAFFLTLLFQQSGLAQTREITGTVTSTEDASAIPGVSVLVKGTSIGTSTLADGTYKLQVPDTAKTLRFSFIGMIAQEIQLGSSNVVNVQLASDAEQLKDVVVTALGIQKKARSLTYSTQEVSGNELSEVKDVNMMNSLTGKSAGVVISKGGSGVGSSSKVVLRGNKSIMGNNEPLYVIDGVPMSPASGTQAVSLYDGFDAGDAISNLNPDDIESMNVLKGASAAALYGSAAANGVIIINTKKGVAGTAGSSKINYSSTATFEKATGLPEIQGKYGQKIQNKSSDSWGASGASANTAAKDFFNTGANFINSIALSNGTEQTQFYISYANTKANGIIPTNELKKHNLNFRGTTKMLNDKLTLDAGINYINQNIANRPQVGFYLNPLVGLYLFPTGDSKGFASYETFEADTNKDGNMDQNWQYMDGIGYSSQNPYWVINRNTNSLKRNRYISAVSAQYSFTDWLKLQGRVTYDRSADVYEQKVYASTDKTIASANGEYTKQNLNLSQLYSDLILTLNKDLSTNVSLLGAVGASNVMNRNENLRFSSYSQRTGLYYMNVFSLQNMKGDFDKIESLTKAQNQAFFATAQIGFNNSLFIDVTGRNEKASTLPQNKNSFFYPSLGASYILSDAIGTSDALSFLKLRASYSQVGNALPFGVADPNPPYGIANNGSIIPRNAIALGELIPERTSSFEFGFDSRFFKDHLTLDFTYYSATSKNQLFTILAPAGSGAKFYFVNGGDIKNSGIELVLGYKIISSEKFSWISSINMSKNKNEVLKLSEDLENDQVVITDYTQTKIYQTIVKTGGSYGDIWGTIYERDGSGNIKKDATTGAPVIAKKDTVLGNPNPKMLLGWSNSFKIQGLQFKFLVDARFGGNVVSYTDAILDAKGLSQRTATARDEGKVVIDGTTFDKPELFYTTIGNAALTEQYIYDATNIRMREISIGYTFTKIVKGVDRLTIALVGRNLFFISNKAPFDPEIAISSGNGLQGLNAFNLPSTRTLGFNVSIAF